MKVTRLATAGHRLAVARARLAASMADAEAAARMALDHGVAEAEVARVLGVDRMTVRKWAGKR